MNRICFSLLMCGMSLVTCLQASQIQASERIPLGARNELSQSSQEQPQALTQSRLSKKELIAKSHEPAALIKKSWSNYNLNRAVRGVGVNGLTLTMDDQTIWEIAPGSAKIAKSWGSGTTFVIYPNNWTIGSWFSQYDYALYNEATGSWVEARLSEGPFVKYAVLTVDIDYNQGFIRLGDGSVWKIKQSSSSFAHLRTWQRRQAILVGRNTGWFTPEHILININENNYLTADFQGFQ